MAQIGSSPVIQKRGAAASDVYTVLALVALLALLVGIGYIVVRDKQLFGSSNPFQVHTLPAPAAATPRR